MSTHHWTIVYHPIVLPEGSGFKAPFCLVVGYLAGRIRRGYQSYCAKRRPRVYEAVRQEALSQLMQDKHGKPTVEQAMYAQSGEGYVDGGGGHPRSTLTWCSSGWLSSLAKQARTRDNSWPPAWRLGGHWGRLDLLETESEHLAKHPSK